MQVKPGYRTTELLVVVLVSVAGWLAEWAGTLAPKWAAIVMAISSGMYIFSRGLTKLGVALGNAKVVPVQTVAPVVPATPVAASPPPAQV